MLNTDYTNNTNVLEWLFRKIRTIRDIRVPSKIFDYIRRRVGAGVITESLTNFRRYLSNVPGIEKTHSRTGNIYYVKYSS